VFHRRVENVAREVDAVHFLLDDSINIGPALCGLMTVTLGIELAKTLQQDRLRDAGVRAKGR